MALLAKTLDTLALNVKVLEVWIAQSVKVEFSLEEEIPGLDSHLKQASLQQL